MQKWYIATGSDADTGVVVAVPVQDGEEITDTDEIELIDDTNTSESDAPEDAINSQIVLLFVLGIIIGILLIGDRRFGS